MKPRRAPLIGLSPRLMRNLPPPYGLQGKTLQYLEQSVAHWVMTAGDGTLHRVKVVDPSFFNWPALSYCLEGNIVPDFPLCNKSFNQSYSGNDL